MIKTLTRLMPALLMLLVACGGNSSPDPTPKPNPDPNPIIDGVRIVKAEAINDTTLSVTFSEGMDAEAGNPVNYSLSPALEVTGASLSEDATVATLNTAPQAEVDYTVTVQNTKSLAGAALEGDSATFTGRNTPLSLKEVTATSTTTVQVIFSEPVSDNAADASNYVITTAAGTKLAVTAAALNEFKTQVTLTTVAQADETYTLKVSNIKDTSGTAIDAAVGVSFKGLVIDDIPPKVANAGATSNTSISVTFSEPVQGGPESAENPDHYTVTADRLTSSLSTQATVIIKQAVLSADKTSVTLTTFPQSQVQYTLVVNEIKDLAGNQISPRDRLTGQTNEAKFVGRPETGTPVDTDGDGLSDAQEQLGWFVVIKKGDAQEDRREVTSDPTEKDTDGDGLSDFEENTLKTDPRVNDTDADELSDYKEYWHTYSDPINLDSDGDGLQDGLEFGFFRTSPTLQDTDGDQIPDGEEVNLDNRNPRVADVPVPNIEIGNVDLQLDVRFSQTDSAGKTVTEDKSVNTTLTQTESEKYSQADSNTNEFMAKIAVEQGWEVKFFGAVGAEGKFSAEAQTTNTWSSSFTQESSREAQEAYSESIGSSLAKSLETSATRTVEGAKMQVALVLKNASNVSFTLQNLQITAFIQDPADVSSLKPVATLVPGDGEASAFNFSPNETKGPLIFSNDKIFPAVVESLLKNPRGLIFKVANYDVTDESDRNFAYTSQDINDRTTPVIIDYGGFDSDSDGQGDDSERLRVATSFGRATEDIDGNGVIDDLDRILFRKDKTQVGITLRDVLEDVMGLTYYDEDETPTESLSAAQRDKSYATKVVEVGGKPVETLWRIRKVAVEDVDGRNLWAVITSKGIDLSQDFNSRVLFTDEGITLAYVQDKDGDLISARWEYLLGCSDDLTDSDADGIADFDEVYEGWSVKIAGRGTYQAFSGCNQTDSDFDGLSDAAEKTLGTDASKKDSDEDGLTDAAEVNGYKVQHVIRGEITVKSNPLSPDTDGDGALDGVEVSFGSNPTVKDLDLVLDNDRDGLSNYQETTVGWTVTSWQVSKTPGAQGVSTTIKVTSDPNKADTDGDNVPDKLEKERGTNPKAADSDGDGWNDKDDTWPRDADFDNDLRGDLEEQQAGCSPYNVMTDPSKADTDGDTLGDGVECKTYRSNPDNPNTDNDDYRDDRELQLKTNILIKDQLVTVTYTNYQVVGTCEDFQDTTCCQNLIWGDGEFSGELKLEKPDSSVSTLYSISRGNGKLGRTYAINKGSSFILAEGSPGFRLFSSNINENDTSAVDLTVLGQMRPEVKGYKLSAANGLQDVGKDNSCKLRINYNWIISR